MIIPDNFRPLGASNDPRWKAVWAYVMAVSSRTAVNNDANAAAEQEAVRAVNEMLAATAPEPDDDWEARSERSYIDNTSSGDAAEGAGEADEFGYFELGRTFFEEFTSLSNGGSFKGFICGCSPVEILVHLVNERDEALAAVASAPPKPADDAMRLTDRELYDNSCITRHQLATWVDSDYAAHIAGLKHTIEFLLARLDALSAPVPSPDGASDWSIGERQAVHNAIFGTSGERGEGTFCANLGPYVRATVASLHRAESLVKMFEDNQPDLVEKYRALIDETGLTPCAPATGAAGYPDGFCSPGGRESCLHLQERERCSGCPVNEEISNAKRDQFETEQHTARFLARLFYYRGVAYGKGVESADAWVDANWRFFLGDARRLGGIAPAVGVTREAIARFVENVAAAYSGDAVVYSRTHVANILATTATSIRLLPPVPDATVSGESPEEHTRVLAFVSDDSVSIHDMPVVAWQDGDSVWWAGLPQSYIKLKDHDWKVDRWQPLASSPQDVGREATVEEICNEIGCAYDKESALIAIDNLKQRASGFERAFALTRQPTEDRICDCDPACINCPCTCERAVHEDGT